MTASLRHPVYDGRRLSGSVERILMDCQLCAIATNDPAGTLHINTAFFCFSEELELYFLSDPGATHARNISRKPEAAIAVYDSRQIWGEAHRGLQMFGTCALISGAVEEKGRILYARRFPGYVEFAAHADRTAGADFEALRLFEFVTNSVKILDEQEFGDRTFIRAEVARRTGERSSADASRGPTQGAESTTKGSGKG